MADSSVAGPATLTTVESSAVSLPDQGAGDPPRIRQKLEEAQMFDAKLNELPEDFLDSLALIHQNFFNSK